MKWNEKSNFQLLDYHYIITAFTIVNCQELQITSHPRNNYHDIYYCYFFNIIIEMTISKLLLNYWCVCLGEHLQHLTIA